MTIPAISSMPADDRPLFRRYVHFTGITVVRVGDKVFADTLWHRDLTHHTYLGESILVVCPIAIAVEPPPGHLEVTDPRYVFEAIPTSETSVGYLLRGMPLRIALKAWNVMADADLVYGAMVEHPMPLGWVVHPVARLRRVLSYVYLESASWREATGVSHGLRYRIRAALVEGMNRFALRFVSFAFMNQPAYAPMLPQGRPVMLSPSTWFLPEEAASEADVKARPLARQGHLQALIASRVTKAKGFGVLVDALLLLEERGIGGVEVTILGGGDMLEEVKVLASRLNHVKVHFAAGVQYGPDFHALTRRFDVVLVPNLADEQPRIVFDAFSQGVPVVASDTTGVLSVVRDGETGVIVKAGSPTSLADALGSLVTPGAPERIRRMGLAGHARARVYNHLDMHAQRKVFIAQMLGAPTAGKVAGGETTA